jgi:hypothetical protein
VVGEVSESEGVAAQCFQAAVDCFGGAVGGVVVEERKDVVAAPSNAASWAISSSPAGTRRIDSITAARVRFPRRRFGSAEAAMIFW